MGAKFCVWAHFYHFTILHFFHIFNFWSVSFFEAPSYLDNVCVVFFGSKVRAGDFHSNGSQSLAELRGWYREHRSSSPRAARLPRVPQLYLRHSSISCDNILCLGISTAASLRSISRCPDAGVCGSICALPIKYKLSHPSFRSIHPTAPVPAPVSLHSFPGIFIHKRFAPLPRRSSPHWRRPSARSGWRPDIHEAFFGTQNTQVGSSTTGRAARIGRLNSRAVVPVFLTLGEKRMFPHLMHRKW